MLESETSPAYIATAMKPVILLVLFALFAVPAARAVAQSGSHTVQVSVATITALQVSAGTVNLTISGAAVVAGQDLMMTVDQSTSLLWGVNSSNKKITVQSSLASATYTLKLEAVNPTSGTSTGPVTLSSTVQDFLLDIGRSSGSCTLSYTGEALASQGVGADTHTITFTISNQ